MHGQVRELLTNYGPIGIVWFDAGGALRVPNRGELIKGDELVAMIHQLQTVKSRGVVRRRWLVE